MTQTPTMIDQGEATILQRIAAPFSTFSGVLFLVLALSQVFVLPRVTTLTVGDLTLTVDEAVAYERRLRAEVTDLEDGRNDLVLPLIDEHYHALMAEKRAVPNAAELMRMIRSTMQGIASNAGAFAVIEALNVDAESGNVSVRGYIDDPQPASMAVLAAAIDALRAESWVWDLMPPTLTRDEVAGGYRSPFFFSFRLHP